VMQGRKASWAKWSEISELSRYSLQGAGKPVESLPFQKRPQNRRILPQNRCISADLTIFENCLRSQWAQARAGSNPARGTISIFRLVLLGFLRSLSRNPLTNHSRSPLKKPVGTFRPSFFRLFCTQTSPLSRFFRGFCQEQD